MRQKRQRTDRASNTPPISAYLWGSDYALLAIDRTFTFMPERLTRAERQIVEAVVGGASNAEIAQRRRRSPHTIGNQLRSIYGKLGISSRAQLIALCFSGTLGRKGQ